MDIRRDGNFASNATYIAWQAWQAALSSAMPGWVYAEVLRGLCEEWENMTVPMSANSYELGMFDGYHRARYDLEKLLQPPPETK